MILLNKPFGQYQHEIDCAHRARRRRRLLAWAAFSGASALLCEAFWRMADSIANGLFTLAGVALILSGIYGAYYLLTRH